jgi:hypothetical protein
MALAAVAGEGACAGGSGGSEPTIPADLVLTPFLSLTTPTVSIIDEEETPGGAPPISGDAEELRGLLDAGLGATYRADYVATGDDGSEQRYTLYSLPTLSRVDSLDAEGERVSIVIARTNGRAVDCVRNGAAWACTETEPYELPAVAAAGPILYPGRSDLVESDVREVGRGMVANVAVRCFTVTQRAAGGVTFEYCMNAEGVVLRQASPQGSVEATSVSGDVSEEDFVLP